MKNIIGLLIAVLLFAGCREHQKPKKSYKTFMIKASGSIETEPNTASFRIDLNCLENTIKLSNECLVDKSNKLTKALIRMGISEENLLTNSVDLRKNYTWTNNGRKFLGYNSSTSTYVNLENLNNLDEVYSELLENQNLELSGLRYSHSNFDSLELLAYNNAIVKAKAIAQSMLSELPETDFEIFKIGNVKISSSAPQNEQVEDDLMMEFEVSKNESKSKSVSINTGTVKVFADVYVEFKIE